MAKKILSVLAVLGCFWSVAQAQWVAISEDPDGWQVEMYSNGSIVVWHTGASCNRPNELPGRIDLFQGATSAEDYRDVKNRFLSLVTTAQAAGRKITVQYEVANGYCEFRSAYLMPRGS